MTLITYLVQQGFNYINFEPAEYVHEIETFLFTANRENTLYEGVIHKQNGQYKIVHLKEKS